jgi:hypothetical protein
MATKPHPGNNPIHRPFDVPPDGTAPKPGPPKPAPLPVYRPPGGQRRALKKENSQ